MVYNEEVVERCKKGDNSAFTELYKTHSKDIYNTIHRLVNHTAEAEDLLQECFITAYHSIHKFESKSSVKTWLSRIAINKSIDSLRKNKVIFGELTGSEENHWDKDEIDEGEFEYKVSEVKNAISNLPLGYRTIVNLYLLENIPQEEIGKMLGISHSTVRTQYKKAKEKILYTLKMKY